MTYLEKLQHSVLEADSTLCVGLDPNLELLPRVITEAVDQQEEQVLQFCKAVIDHTAEYCAAFKPNLAFFEALGAHGFRVLHEVIAHIPEGKIVIADAKRGDISSTAEHYKKTFFDQFKVDAVTLNPLMGFETLDAFSADESKGLYILTLTSNPGAADFFKKPFDGFDSLSEYIAHSLFERSVEVEAHYGMVIGATQSDIAAPVIRHHSTASLLIPGIGAQGGSVEQLASLLEEHEGIPLINSSRGIIYAGSEHDNWADHVSRKAKETKDLLKPVTQQYV